MSKIKKRSTKGLFVGRPGEEQSLQLDIGLAVIDAIGDAVTIQDTAFKVLYQNGTSVSEAGRHIGDYCYEAYENNSGVCEGCQLEKAFRDGLAHRAVRKVLRGNETRHLEITASPLRDPEGRIIAGIEVVRDVTDRAKMEEQLFQAKQDWEDIFNQITEMITVHDRDFNIIRANRAAEETLGLPALKSAKCFEYYHGRGCPPEKCPSCASLKTMQPGTAEFFEPHLNRFLEISAIPRFDVNHRIAGLIHIGRDITERKRLESIANAASLMDNIGYVFSGIRHEIGNPVNTAKIILSVLKKKLSVSGAEKISGRQEIEADIDAALEQIARAEFLLKSLRNFNMFENVEISDISVQLFIEKFLGLAGRDFLDRGIEIVRDVAADVECALADARALQQVFLNIFANAADALAGSERPKIAIRARKLGKTVVLSVEDNGRGIPRGQMKNLFKPFYTTKASGTGLGLVMVKKMMTKMNGALEIASNEGEGTTVSLFLPACP